MQVKILLRQKKQRHNIGNGSTEHRGKDTESTEKKRRPVPASPSTRRLARELEVDLYEVTPTGSGGIVTKEDVESHAGRKAVPELTITSGRNPRAPPPRHPLQTGRHCRISANGEQSNGCLFAQ